MAEADAAGSTLSYPLGAVVPQPGEVVAIADGLGWTRSPVPGALNHINCWLLADEGGIAVVDCGIDTGETREAWERALGERAVTRVFATHFHPDHIGAAGWLCERYAARLWMSRTEWLTARMLTLDARDAMPPEATMFYRQAGWTEEQLAQAQAQGWGMFAKAVGPLPAAFVRLASGDELEIGGRRWRVVVGSGHTPEHVCLVDFARRLMIAGDQVLPRITSNVSLSLSEPEGDPLADWLASIDELRALPDDLLVLPSHGKPFRGLHARLDQLATGHEEGLARLEAMVRAAPRRVVDCFPALFRRPITDGLRGLATGEAAAHLRTLERRGRIVVEEQGGVRWFRAA